MLLQALGMAAHQHLQTILAGTARAHKLCGETLQYHLPAASIQQFVMLHAAQTSELGLSKLVPVVFFSALRHPGRIRLRQLTLSRPLNLNEADTLD